MLPNRGTIEVFRKRAARMSSSSAPSRIHDTPLLLCRSALRRSGNCQRMRKFKSYSDLCASEETRGAVAV